MTSTRAPHGAGLGSRDDSLPTASAATGLSATRLVFWILRLVSLLMIAGAVYLASQQWQLFVTQAARYPQGSTSGGVPVGGLSREQAASRLRTAYGVPVMLLVDGSPVALDPAQVDFTLDLEAMLPRLAIPTSIIQDRQDFTAFLKGHSRPASSLPLKASFSEEKLRRFLIEQVAPRYNQAPVAARVVPGQIAFQPGKPGRELDAEAAIEPVASALRSLDRREVALGFTTSPPLPLAWKDLPVLLRQLLDADGFQGLAGVYLHDLRSGNEAIFARQNGEDIAKGSEIAFTAGSIMKIPIMISVMRRASDPPGENTGALLAAMFTRSSNDAADLLMHTVIDDARGPLLVTEDMRKLGLQNTFLAGYFALGSPMLQAFATPANTRADITTDPDPYSQTTPEDIGKLLVMIAQCAADGSGPLPLAFPGEVSRAKCARMIEYMKMDRQGYLITAGLPDGTPIAHKHAYAATHGTIDTIGDGGLVISPAGDYVLVVFLSHPELLWDPSNYLVGTLSQAVYEYLNYTQEGRP